MVARAVGTRLRLVTTPCTLTSQRTQVRPHAHGAKVSCAGTVGSLSQCSICMFQCKPMQQVLPGLSTVHWQICTLFCVTACACRPDLVTTPRTIRRGQNTPVRWQQRRLQGHQFLWKADRMSWREAGNALTSPLLVTAETSLLPATAQHSLCSCEESPPASRTGDQRSPIDREAVAPTSS
jgi:hypothetical protein